MVQLAQLVESWIVVPVVMGSSPILHPCCNSRRFPGVASFYGLCKRLVLRPFDSWLNKVTEHLVCYIFIILQPDDLHTKRLILNCFQHFPYPCGLREKVIYHRLAIRYRAAAGSMFLAPAPCAFVS